MSARRLTDVGLDTFGDLNAEDGQLVSQPTIRNRGGAVRAAEQVGFDLGSACHTPDDFPAMTAADVVLAAIAAPRTVAPHPSRSLGAVN